MLFARKHSSTSNAFRVTLRNSSTGQGLTGLDHTSTGLIIALTADNESAATTYTVAASNVETITTLGTYAAPTASKCRFKAVDGTNHPGDYELQFADSRFSVSSAKLLKLTISGATNLSTYSATIQLDPVPSNLQQISDDSTAADNAESFFDGTGYGHILVRTTIATLASQTSFTLTAGSADDNAYNNCIAVIQDSATPAQKAVGIVDDYTGSTKTITLRADPAIFTMAVGDTITVVADNISSSGALTSDQNTKLTQIHTGIQSIRST